ncbi:hypothetical protein HP499_22300 [Paenarthrobacter sp. CM16]|uniref:hypothetical protein n=1 Tax=Paenarthrobacter sp. CM16 TaxID=2738447 RepID=UPI0015532C50|nr:hypothetical protein [Paenarthrobacter sp. CM16]NQD90519.1 hypothetical protein [Paenarthrobacter sp. CM16]
MISLQQDPEGFVRMKRHFPGGASVSILFTDGTQEVFTGQRLNDIYDQALAAYRAGNHLDAKGFNRGPRKKVQETIEFIPVAPGMSA